MDILGCLYLSYSPITSIFFCFTSSETGAVIVMTLSLILAFTVSALTGRGNVVV